MKILRAVAFLAIVLAGCGSEPQKDLQEWMAEEAKGMRGKVPPLPELTPFPPVAYEGRNLIVPFSSQKLTSDEPVADKLSPDADRPRQPLENFALEDLRVAGIIVKNGIPYAIIIPPAPQKPKHVRVGEFMGKSFGKVIAINTGPEGGELRVLESIKDNNGVWEEREVIKPLPRQGDKR